jgi:TM2 domain-containing membrane protein YozV
MALMYCRECGNQVSSEAPTCPHCGVPRPVILPAVVQPELYYRHPVSIAPRKEHDTTVAALLSFFMPGVGQMYKGDVGLGVGFLVGTFVGYMACIFPGIILHIVSIINAAQKD